MRILTVGHAAFAIAMVSLGIVGMLNPVLVPVWNPVPASGQVGALLVRLGAFVSLATGLGLVFSRTAAMVARLILTTLSLWLLLFRLPTLLYKPPFVACWSVFPLAVMLAAAWVLYVWSATDWDRRYLGYIACKGRVRAARTIYSLSLIFFGLAHFIDLDDTLSLIPNWMPAHLFWAYFTGCAFIFAGIAILVGIWGQLAALLAAVQIGLFLFLVWIPIVGAGSKDTFQWSETILNAALLTGAWVVADSYREGPGGRSTLLNRTSKV